MDYLELYITFSIQDVRVARTDAGSFAYARTMRDILMRTIALEVEFPKSWTCGWQSPRSFGWLASSSSHFPTRWRPRSGEEDC